MTKTYMVKVDAKRKDLLPGSEKVRAAVWNTARHPGESDYRTVTVSETVQTEVDADFLNPLYALGRKDGKKWFLLDFFNSRTKAENAVRKSVRNYKNSALAGEFAVLSLCPTLMVWRIEGESEKVG